METGLNGKEEVICAVRKCGGHRIAVAVEGEVGNELRDPPTCGGIRRGIAGCRI